jgi:hypothetical protein
MCNQMGDKAMATNYPTPGTQEWLAAKAPGPMWEYQDARGVVHIGYMQCHIDHGGTDQTEFMYDQTTGELSVVSGSRLKAMRRVK